MNGPHGLIAEMGYPIGKRNGRTTWSPEASIPPNIGYVNKLHVELKRLGYTKPSDKKDYMFKKDELDTVKQDIKHFFATVPKIQERGPNKRTINKRPGAFQISVKSIMGKWLTFSITSTTTVKELKKLISDKEGDRDVQRLIYGGKQLEDDRTVSDYAITQGSNVFEEGRLRGGAPKAQTTEDSNHR